MKIILYGNMHETFRGAAPVAPKVHELLKNVLTTGKKLQSEGKAHARILNSCRFSRTLKDMHIPYMLHHSHANSNCEYFEENFISKKTPGIAYRSFFLVIQRCLDKNLKNYWNGSRRWKKHLKILLLKTNR